MTFVWQVFDYNFFKDVIQTRVQQGYEMKEGTCVPSFKLGITLQS
jgi:hypothetical protein